VGSEGEVCRRVKRHPCLFAQSADATAHTARINKHCPNGPNGDTGKTYDVLTVTVS
jgi:hypothetical protein